MPAGEAGGLQRASGKLKRYAEALGQQPHLLSIRDGVVGALPLLLVGSVFLLVAQPPNARLLELVKPYQEQLLLPYRMLGGVLALYVCFGCAHALARRYGLDPLSNALGAAATFLVALGPTPLAAGGRGVALERLGASGMFGALALAIFYVELTRFFEKRRWTIRLPGGAPEAVVRSFAALIPTFVAIVGIWAIVHGVHLDLVGLAAAAAAPLVHAGNALPAAWAVVLIDSGMWLLGLHASAVLAAFRPVWLQMLVENMNAAAAGLHPPNVGVQELFQFFVWQGGSGATLAVAIWLLRARSAALRSVGKLAAVPALFNINEPILFGLPMVLNGALAVPFLLAPLCTATTTWCAFHCDWVARPRVEVIWTLPAPIGAYLTTGGDARAIVLSLFNLALSYAIYAPFLRRYDRRLLAREQAAAETR
jgi:PTS system cellobiose-specific IIC component